MATATETYEELKARVADGDTSVTPAQLEKARAAAEHTAMVDQAKQVEREREAAEQLEADRAAHLEQAPEDLAETLEAGRAAYAVYVEAHRALQDAVTAHNHRVREVNARGWKLGLDRTAEPVDGEKILDAAASEVAGHAIVDGKDYISGTRFEAKRLRRHPFHPPEYADAFDEQQRRRMEARFEAEKAERERRRAAEPPAGPRGRHLGSAGPDNVITNRQLKRGYV